MSTPRTSLVGQPATIKGVAQRIRSCAAETTRALLISRYRGRAFSSGSCVTPTCRRKLYARARHSSREHLNPCAAQSTGESSTALAPDMTQTKVLFVCLGNICRSPTAEAVFKKVVNRANVADEFVIDSCGTGGGNEDWYKLGTRDGWAYHEGNPADERMTEAAKKRDIHLTSKSRPLRPEDFAKFDFIIGMDYENSKAIKQAAEHWQNDLKESLPSNWKDKIRLMCEYLTRAEYKELKEVPDPYFGGKEGFEKVLDLLEDACEGLLSQIESSKFATES